MTTSDGISTGDWDLVHQLSVDLVNAEEGEDEEHCRHKLFEYLDELEDKYGSRPSILATRADFIVDAVPRRLDLFNRAYALGWMFVADRQLGLAGEHHTFIGGALIYSVGTIHFLSQHVLPRLHGRGKKTLAVTVAECPLMLFFILFSLGAVPWPQSILPYVAGSVVIAPVMIAGVDWLFRARA